MLRTLSEKNPFRIHTATRRSKLQGEAARWYDRAQWLRGRTLNVSANQRTAFQHDLDTLWQAVDQFSRAGTPQPDTDRLERTYRSFFKRWPEVFGENPADAPF